MRSYYTYILECSDGSFYTGMTANLDERLWKHHLGYYKSCYTYKRRPLLLKYYLEFDDVNQAILFEKRLKGWTRAKKLALIDGNFERIQLLAECRNVTHSDFKPDTDLI